MASFKRQNTRGFKQQSLTNRRTAVSCACLSPDAHGGRCWQLLGSSRLMVWCRVETTTAPAPAPGRDSAVDGWVKHNGLESARQIVASPSPCMNCLTSLQRTDPTLQLQILLKSCVSWRNFTFTREDVYRNSIFYPYGLLFFLLSFSKWTQVKSENERELKIHCWHCPLLKEFCL